MRGSRRFIRDGCPTGDCGTIPFSFFSFVGGGGAWGVTRRINRVSVPQGRSPTSVWELGYSGLAIVKMRSLFTGGMSIDCLDEDVGCWEMRILQLMLGIDSGEGAGARAEERNEFRKCLLE